jgi:hypothetical protein
MTRAKPPEIDRSPPLRWYQYRLRTLLAIMVLANLAMSAVATRMQAARRQRDAVAAILKSGGSVCYYGEFDTPSLYHSASERRPLLEPLWLRKLFGDDFFRTVELVYVESDADFEHLKQLDQLKRLVCSDAITERGLAQLKELRQLRDLDLMNSVAAAPGIKHIATLTRLEELNLSSTDVGDAELECLKGMTQLRYLGLVGTKITDAGLRHLEGLTRLRELALNKTAVGDAGVAHLKGLSQLELLGLGETRITDAALPHVAGLKHLRDLQLQLTAVSAEGVRKITRALPHCNINSTVIMPPEEPRQPPGKQ